MGDLAPGTRIGSYTVERLVGRGGFGAVYVAQDRKLGRRVALKVLDEGLLEDDRSRARFVEESRQAASLDHPNIVPIFEAGTAGGRPWLAMRYVPGPDLDGLIAKDGRLPPDRTARIVTQVAAALDAAHGAGLVHRDVKPGNVLLATSTDGADHAYLTDFGLSKRVGGTGAVTATRTGRFVGTVGYVAPEQIKGRTIDARADVYSLGCLAFHVLTGAAPFARDSEIDTLMAHVDAPVPSVHEVLPDLADRVDPVLARAMAKEPGARHATAGAFAAELTAALGSRDRLSPVTRGFLFSDLRGYTAFIEANGDAAAVALLDRYRRHVREVVARHGGAEIKTEGDSFYVVFPSASAAVEAGLGIVAAAEGATAGRPDLPITVGVGIHAGESAETAEGYVGSSVNIAARACAQAAAGEVLITDTVRSLVRTSLAAELVPKGKRQLKGITEPVALYAVRRPVERAPGPDAGRAGRRPGTGALVPVGGPRGPGRWLIGVAGAMVIALVAVGGLLVAGALPGDSPSASPTSRTGAAGIERILFARETDEIDAGCEVGSMGVEASRTFAVGRNGADLRELPLDGDLWVSAPAIAPDGGSLAFWGSLLRTAGLFLWDPASGEPRQATGIGPFPDFSVRHARWSPDGSRVAWVDPLGLDGAMGWETEGMLTVMTVGDGSIRTAFTPDAPPDEGASPVPSAQRSAGGPDRVELQGASDRIRAADWLPDGTLVIAAGSDLWALDRDLAPRRRLGSLPGQEIVAMAVSPLGDRIAVAAGSSSGDDRPGPADIHVVPLDGGEPLRLTDDPAVDTQPAWSPDGSEIAFTSDRAGRHAIYAITADGTAIRSVTRPAPGYHDCWPAWGVVAPEASAAFLPTPSPGPGEVAPPLEFRRGPLAPGMYRTTDFQPGFRVTTTTPWKVRYNVADAIRADHRPSDEVRHELQILRLTTAYDPVCQGADDKPTTLLGPAPREVIEWLRSRPELTTGEPIPRIIGGRPVLEMGFAMRDGLTSTEICGVDQIPSGLTLFPSGGDLVVLRDGQAGRVWVFDVGGEAVTVMATGTADGFDDAVADVFAPLVYSLAFDAPAGPAPRASGAEGSPAATIAASPSKGAAGTRIVFSRQVADSDVEWAAGCSDVVLDAKLMVLDPGDPSGTPYRLTSGTDLYEREPAWSLDGSTIVFVGDIQNRLPGVFAVPPGGAPLMEAAIGNDGLIFSQFGPGEVAVSPDGRWIAWAADDLVVAAADGSGARRIAGPDPDTGDKVGLEDADGYRSATFLPDGTILALGTLDDGSGMRLETFRPDGSGHAILPVDLGAADVLSLVAAPDGTRAIAAVYEDDREQLRILDLVEGTFGPFPGGDALAREGAWAPDGTSIAYVSSASGHDQIWSVKVATGRTRQLTDLAEGNACSPAWGPETPDLARPRPSRDPAPLERGALAPGRYVAELHRPPIAFSVGDGWLARRNYPDGLSLHATGLGGELDTGIISVGLGGPCHDDPQVVLGTRPQDLIAWLESRDDLDVTNPRAVNVGGYTGISVDVQQAAGGGCRGEDLTALYLSGQDSTWLGPGEQVRIFALDVEGTTVSLELYTVADSREELLARAQEVIDTIAFPASGQG